MSRENAILQELHEVDRSPTAVRRFALIMAGACVVLAGISYWKNMAITGWFLGLGGTGLVFTVTGLLAPRLLGGLHLAWMFLSLCMGWVMSRVILILLFVLVILPTHVLGRLFGLSFMNMRRGHQAASLWVKKAPRERQHHEKLF